MVPSSSVARALLISATYVAMRYGGQEGCLDLGRVIDTRGTRWVSKSSRNSASPAGGFLISSISRRPAWHPAAAAGCRGRRVRRHGLGRFQHDFFLRKWSGFFKVGDHQSATGMPTAKVVSRLSPPTGAGFSYLVAGLSSRLGGGFFMKPSATVNCCGLMHSSAMRWPRLLVHEHGLVGDLDPHGAAC